MYRRSLGMQQMLVTAALAKEQMMIAQLPPRSKIRHRTFATPTVWIIRPEPRFDSFDLCAQAGRRHIASQKETLMKTSLMMRLLLSLLLVVAPTTLAIQVECRQCHILKQNEEYFEHAKQVVNKRHECKPMMPHAAATTEQVVDYDDYDDSSEPPLVESAASTGTYVSWRFCVEQDARSLAFSRLSAFVPRQNPHENFGLFAPQVGLQETVFAYRTSYQ